LRAEPVLVWTPGDVIGLSLLVLSLGALAGLWIGSLIYSAFRRIGNSFRNLWNRKHG